MAEKRGTCRKAPSDTLKQSFDFGPDLPDGVTLSSAAAASASGTGITVGAVPTTSGSVATVTITGGKKGETHVVEVTGTYSDSQVRTFAFEVIVL